MLLLQNDNLWTALRLDGENSLNFVTILLLSEVKSLKEGIFEGEIEVLAVIDLDLTTLLVDAFLSPIK